MTASAAGVASTAALVVVLPASLLGGSAAGSSGAGSPSSSVDAFRGGLLFSPYVPMGRGFAAWRNDERRRLLLEMLRVGSGVLRGGGGGCGVTGVSDQPTPGEALTAFSDGLFMHLWPQRQL